MVAGARERVAARRGRFLRLRDLRDRRRRAGLRGGNLRRRLLHQRRCRRWLLRQRRALLRLLCRLAGAGHGFARGTDLQPVAFERDAAIILGWDAVVALAGAVDHRTGIRIGGEVSLGAEQPVAQRSGHIGVAGIEPRQRIARRNRDRSSDRLRKIVGRFVDGAERRGERSFLRTIDDGLARQQRRKVLVSDLARQRQQHHDTEPERGPQTTLRLVARCNHQ